MVGCGALGGAFGKEVAIDGVYGRDEEQENVDEEEVLEDHEGGQRPGGPRGCRHAPVAGIGASGAALRR